MPTDIVVNSATVFFGITIASKKKSKGWWSKDINKVGKTAKNGQFTKQRQTPANLKHLNEQKIFIQNLIKESKLMFHKNIEYLNQSNDFNPFWHIYMQ